MKRHFGDRLADALKSRTQDQHTFEQIVRAIDCYATRPRDKHRVTRTQGRGELFYMDVKVCTFYVRRGKIIVHPRSADAEHFTDVDAAVDRMAILLADVIASQHAAEVVPAPQEVSHLATHSRRQTG